MPFPQCTGPGRRWPQNLFFRNHGDENHIDLRDGSHDARQDRKERSLRVDAPVP
jgi:hypothetical protein